MKEYFVHISQLLSVYVDNFCSKIGSAVEKGLIFLLVESH